MTIYAVQYGGRWNIAKRVSASKYSLAFADGYEGVVWADAYDTSMICEEHLAEQIIELPAPPAKEQP